MKAPIVIKEIDRSFKSVAELSQYVITQNKALIFATDRIKSLEESIKTLTETKVSDKKITDNVTSIVRSIPEAICQIEIERLMEKAMKGPLDWEETKKLDVLIKNYYLARESETPKSPKKELPKDIVLTDDFLTQLANDGK